MEFQELLRAQLVRHEGLRLSPYRCSAGKLTIGVGHNLDAVPITERAAIAILDDDLADVFAQLDKHLPWWRDLDENRRLVLADMAFNLGVPGLMKFKNTLAAIRAGRYEMAATNMLESLWAKQVGKRAITLAKMMRGDA